MEQQSLQNFADKFNLTVIKINNSDKRKKINTYYLINENNNSVSPNLPYNELNNFLLGWNNALKYNK